jgi:hypothetical protein
MLHSVTTGINFLALMAALWLGLYLVTRSPHRPESWLSALALWSMGGYFFNQLLALYPPPTPPLETRVWLHHLILFWPRDVYELGWQGWLQGWLPSYGIFFWYHATLYMLPGRFHRGRLALALVGYAVGLAGILIKVRYSYAWVNPAGNPLYLSYLRVPLLLLFGIGFVAFAGLGAYNVARTMRSSPGVMPRAQFRLFLYATLLGGASGLTGIASYVLDTPIPQLSSALLLFAALLLAGIGVARYNALLEHRPLWRDFFYSASEAGAILLVYMFLLGIAVNLYPLPPISFLLVGCIAVITHLLIDVARLQLDRLYLHDRNRRLRMRLRRLSREIENGHGSEALEMALETIANAVGASWLFMLVFTADGIKPAGSWNWTGSSVDELWVSFPIESLHTEDLLVLNPHSFPPPFEEAAVVVPLFERGQIGALLAGPSRGQWAYSEIELERLQNSGDIVSNLLRGFPTEGEATSRLDEAVLSSEVGQACIPDETLIRLVELGLRNMHDYSYLGSSPLASIRLVERCLECPENGVATHIDRGKAVSVVLKGAVTQLRPAPEEPNGSIPRTWYPYIILRDAYLDGVPNREIMSRLYISEGTFNRTRRAAISSVARLLNEMEAALE